MALSTKVQEIIANYDTDNPGTKANLVKLLTHGRLGNTGHMIIYPVDQGFEHGPDRSFAVNPAAYDPHYHFQLAIDAGLSAFAAPLGLLEAGAHHFAGQVPLILKMNSANSMSRIADTPCQADLAITASVADALRLGCVGIGFTIYPGTDNAYELFEEIRSLAEEAKACGLAVIIWSYPRGNMSKEGETGVDVVGYAAHTACLLGAHIVKVKIPSEHIEFKAANIEFQQNNIAIKTLEDRLSHIRQCCFSGRRMVIFSGGASKPIDEVYEEARAIAKVGANGHIIGRNVFRRPRTEALELLDNLVKIYTA